MIPHVGLYFCAFGPWWSLYCTKLNGLRLKFNSLVSAKHKVTHCHSVALLEGPCFMSVVMGYFCWILDFYVLRNSSTYGSNVAPLLDMSKNSLTSGMTCSWKLGMFNCSCPSCLLIVVVTFFNHNFVNCKTTLILEIKNLRNKIWYKPKW